MIKQLLNTIIFINIYFTGAAQSVKCIDPSLIIFKAKVDSAKNMDQGIYMIPVKTTITNNSSDTLRYLSMQCSWAQYYVVDEDGLHLPVAHCDQDSAILITIAPHKHEERIIGLVSLHNTKQLHSEKFKVGLIFVQACDLDKASKQLKKSKNTIWSNTLSIK